MKIVDTMHLSQKTEDFSFNYLPVTERDMDIGMFVKGVGKHELAPYDTYPVTGHPSTYSFDPSIGRRLELSALVYITKGKGFFKSEDMETEVGAGSLIVLYPDAWHTYYPKKEVGWHEYWVVFSGEISERYLNAITKPSVPVVDIGINDNIVQLFSKMFTFAKWQLVGFQYMLSGIMLHMLGQILMVVKNQSYNNKDVERIQKARVMIEERVYDGIKPEDIADTLHMSYSSFRKFFKQYTGMAPLQYILQLKIEKAKEQLMYSEASIKEIALDLNFESTDYFSSFFRAKVGVSPHKYRSLHK